VKQSGHRRRSGEPEDEIVNVAYGAKAGTEVTVSQERNRAPTGFAVLW
jgi:hypothetical protein